MRYPLVIILGVLLHHSPSFAQQPLVDTAFVAVANISAARLYNQSMMGQSHLLNGTEYHVYEPLKEEHPYLEEDWAIGNIEYDGEIYIGVPLLFDLSTDQLITEHPIKSQPIRLIHDKVKWFSIKGRRFDHLRDSLLKDSFYEVIYGGNTKVYRKVQKDPQEKLDGRELNRYFDERVWYYLQKNNVFHPVRRKKDVLDVLGDRKAELKRFLSENKIRFRSNKAEALARMAEYYDQIDR